MMHLDVSERINRLATVAIIGVVFFATSATLLPIISEYSFAGDYISELAIGRFGYVQTVAFFAIGLGSLALALGIRETTKDVWGSRVGCVLLGLFGVSLLLAGIFPTDAIDAAGRTHSPSTAGAIHIAVSLLAFVSAVAGMLVLSRTFKQDAWWRSVWPYSMALACGWYSRRSGCVPSLQGRSKEGRSRMIEAKWRHRVKGKEFLAVLVITGAAVSAGAIVARRSRYGLRDATEAPGSYEAPGALRPLIGHEFSIMGHDFHVIESSRDTDDGSLRFDYSAPPRANVSEHTHHFQEESFEVVSGTLGLRVGGRELLLTPGQSATGPPRVSHAWWNPSDEERVSFVAGIRPGIEVETMFETLLGLMRQGKTIGPLPRNPLQAAVLAQEIGSWVVLGPLEKVLLAPVSTLAFVGGLLGYRARYPQYSGPGGQSREERAAPL